MRVLIIGSNNTWRMEMATARAFERAGHTVKVIDDRRIKRVMGWPLTQRIVRVQAEHLCAIRSEDDSRAGRVGG